jgi:MtN3 and saliva related transmembrane protein
MSSVELLGYLAAFCTTASFLPQAFKSIRHRDTKSLSLVMYITFTLGIGLWLAYGILRKDYAIIAANAVTMVISLAILITKVRCDVLPARRGGDDQAGQ